MNDRRPSLGQDSKGSILKELKEDIFIYFFDWIKNIFEDSRFPFFFYIWFLQQLGYTPLWIYPMELSN